MPFDAHRPYPLLVNPRRMVVEDRALALSDALDANGRTYLAARLRGAVPQTFGLCDEHVPLLRDALVAVVAEVSEYAASAAKVLAALDDLPAAVGRRGRVMVGRDRAGAYSAHWTDADWLEEGPEGVTLDAVLAWAEPRSSDVRLPPDV